MENNQSFYPCDNTNVVELYVYIPKKKAHYLLQLANRLCIYADNEVDFFKYTDIAFIESYCYLHEWEIKWV